MPNQSNISMDVINSIINEMGYQENDPCHDTISDIKETAARLPYQANLDKVSAHKLRDLVERAFADLSSKTLGPGTGLYKNVVLLVQLYQSLKPLAEEEEYDSMDNVLNDMMGQKAADYRDRSLFYLMKSNPANTLNKNKAPVSTKDSFSKMDKDMLKCGLITQEEYEADQFALMLTDPAYNAQIYQASKAFIKGGLDAEKNKNLLNILGLEAGKSAENYRESVYKLCYLSGRLSVFHNQKNDFKTKVRGDVYPESFSKIKNKVFSQMDIDDVKKYHSQFSQQLTEKNIANVDPERFQKSIARFEADHGLSTAREADAEAIDLDSMTYTGYNLLTGISSSDLNELSHNRGNFRSSNSDYYNAMGDALGVIRGKMTRQDQVSPDDYRNLFDACVDYMNYHDSKPASTSGKNRFNAAARITVALLEDPRLITNAKQRERIINLGMIRSKVFRDAYVDMALKRLQTIKDMGQRNGKVNNDMAEEARHLLTDIMFANSLDRAFGSKKMQTGKLKDDEAIDKLIGKYANLKNQIAKYVQDNTQNSDNRMNGLLQVGGLLEQVLNPNTRHDLYKVEEKQKQL